MRTLIHVFLTRDKDIKVSDGQDRKSESAQLFFKCLFYLRYFLHNVFSLICTRPRIGTNKRLKFASNKRRIFGYPCRNKHLPLICSSFVISAASPYATLLRNITVI